MNESRDRIRALWVRQLSDEQLTEAESQLLKNALREDSELMRELSDDATSHALLQSLEQITQTEDVFVQAVMQQVTEIQQVPLAAANSKPSVPAPFVSSDHESTGLPMVANKQSSNDSRASSRQRFQQWTSILLTLVLFLSVGVVFWLQSQQPSEIAGTSPSPGEQDAASEPETPLQKDNSESVNERDLIAADDLSPDDGEMPTDAANSPPQIAGSDNTPGLSVTENNVANSDPPSMSEETPPAVVSHAFATLTRLNNPVWEREDSVGSRLGDEVVRLFGGTIELTFDDGAVVTLEGPVEFQPRSAGLLDLRRGQLSANVPKPAIGFTVLTPTSEVVDLGTEFEVSVKDTGASDVVIRKGEVEVAPGGRTGRDIQKWKLVPGGLNRASFYARPDKGQPGPIVAKVQGARGQFQGIISIDGKTAKFRSEDTFNNVHERVITQLKNPQDNVQRQWQDFVDSLQNKMRGTMNLNGRQMQFGNLDEVMRLHNQLRNQLNSNAATPFNGSINVNGQVIKFSTREEFEAARRTAFGPAANFGAGDVSDMQNGPR